MCGRQDGEGGSTEAKDLRDDLAKVLVMGGLAPSKDAFGQLHMDSNAMVARSEFLAAISEDLALFKLFDEIDTDGNGSLDREELKKLQKELDFMQVRSHSQHSVTYIKWVRPSGRVHQS